MQVWYYYTTYLTSHSIDAIIGQCTSPSRTWGYQQVTEQYSSHKALSLNFITSLCWEESNWFAVFCFSFSYCYCYCYCYHKNLNKFSILSQVKYFFFLIHKLYCTLLYWHCTVLNCSIIYCTEPLGPLILSAESRRKKSQ